VTFATSFETALSKEMTEHVGREKNRAVERGQVCHATRLSTTWTPGGSALDRLVTAPSYQRRHAAWTDPRCTLDRSFGAHISQQFLKVA